MTSIPSKFNIEKKNHLNYLKIYFIYGSESTSSNARCSRAFTADSAND